MKRKVNKTSRGNSLLARPSFALTTEQPLPPSLYTMLLREQGLALPLPSIYSPRARPCNPLFPSLSNASHTCRLQYLLVPICVLTNNTSSLTTFMTSAAVWPFVLASVPVIPSLKRSSKVNIAESRSWKRNATQQYKWLHNLGRVINVILARNMVKLIHCMKCAHSK